MRIKRQWGWYETLLEEPKLVIRRICLNPESCTPLKYETHVTKYWTLIEGSGSVCLGKPDKSTWRTAAGSTWKVHDKMMHQLATEKEALLIIEVICGNIAENNTVVLEV